jgi:DNA-binding response OmpR family regulator
MGKKVLLVDDDIELGNELKELLVQEGYEVTNTDDTSKVDALIHAQEFQINILDFKMPGLNGIELLRKLKTQNPQTKVIMISGRPFIEKLIKEEDVSHLLDRLVTKPFKIEYLVEQMGEVLQAASKE